MRTLFLLLFFTLTATVALAQADAQETAKIRQEMAKIRQTTNWNDPVAAKKANEQIQALAKKLMMGGNSQGKQDQGSPQNQNLSEDAEKDAEMNQEMVDQKMKIWDQIWKTVAGGKGADILLAEPLRDEIAEEYKEDENTSISPEMQEQMNVLVLDMSMEGIDAIIDQMDLFQSITTLIITSSVYGYAVNLDPILKKAEHYPLTDLYIVNFGSYVTTLPAGISMFKNLTTIGVFNNQLTSLPSEVSNLKELKVLYIDNNPVATVFPGISQLHNLEVLGIINTNIPGDEISRIKQLFPNCKVMSK
jgi:hypothetical protein